MKTLVNRTIILTIFLWISTGFDFELPPPSGSFEAFAGGVAGQAWCIAVAPNGDVYVGGSFSSVNNGTLPANNIAKWDGISWSPLSSGLNSTPTDLVFDSNGILYASGNFTNAGGMFTPFIAKWDGSSWSSVGGGFNGQVLELEIDANDHVWAAGSFTTALPSTTVNNIARWDGTTWNPIADMGTTDPLGYGVGSSITGMDIGPSGDVLVCGTFSQAGFSSGFNGVARWNGTTWENLGNDAFDNNPSCILEAPNGNIYVGGSFTTEGSQTVNGIVEYDGTDWNSINTGVSGVVLALEAKSNSDVIVAGSFATAGATTVNNLALWDGTNWNNFGNGLGSFARFVDLDIVEDIYLAGNFGTANGLTVNNVTKWSGVLLSADLIDFQAQNRETGVQLDWSTATESETTQFAIQRSRNATDWFTIGALKASGESQIEIHYQYTDASPLAGQSYYRLKTLLLNGQLDYSEIREIKRMDYSRLSIFPNPTTNFLQINGWDGKYLPYQIFNAQGILVQQGHFAGQQIDIQLLPSGMFYLYVGVDEETIQRSFFKTE